MTFLIDADGILQVEARDLRNGKEASIEVRPSFGLREEEIESMIAAKKSNELSDFEFKRWVEVRNQSEPVLQAAEKKLPDAFRLLPKSEAEAIENLCRRMRGAIEKQEAENVQNLKYELNAMTTRLAERVIAEILSKR